MDSLGIMMLEAISYAYSSIMALESTPHPGNMVVIIAIRNEVERRTQKLFLASS